MKTEQLDYDLPPELIAQQPCGVRSESRLLKMDRNSGNLTDSRFSDLGKFLIEGDCLVLNDTKVLPARFYGRRKSGGKLEGLFLNETETGVWEVMLKGAGKIKDYEKIEICDRQENESFEAAIVERKGEGRYLLKIQSNLNCQELLERIGFPPLPPYIKRGRDIEQAEVDRQRYQTVYAKIPGAVAAPTAGLHFTENLIGELKEKGIKFAYITLHTGAGTFKPITAQTLEEHIIHKEWFTIDEKNAQIINDSKKSGCRIIAVGTTSVRALETIAVDKYIKPFSGTTELFIKPGYQFKIIDGIVTNFHLPRSSLLALVAAFAGLQNILNAYKHAIEQRYRFYSYGDAMLIV
jgi:S-adenosylmethionine:tRNA ribosyltransferase-isomerase